MDTNLFTFIFYNVGFCLAYFPALLLDSLLTPIVIVLYGRVVFGFVRGVWKYQKGFNSDFLSELGMSEEERARCKFETIDKIQQGR
jgi:hypothetical protein